jgi:hypothetical protein
MRTTARLFSSERVAFAWGRREKLHAQTVTDLYSDKQMEHNANIVVGVDRARLKARTWNIAQYGE